MALDMKPAGTLEGALDWTEAPVETFEEGAACTLLEGQSYVSAPASATDAHVYIPAKEGALVIWRAATSDQKEQRNGTSFQYASLGVVPQWKLGYTAFGETEDWKGDVGFLGMREASRPSRLNTDIHEYRQSHCGQLCKTRTRPQQSRDSTDRMPHDHRHLGLLGRIHGAGNFPATASLRLTSCAAGEADGYQVCCQFFAVSIISDVQNRKDVKLFQIMYPELASM